MVGTKAGGAKARDANLMNDPDFYSKIGKRGGSNGHTGGFFADRELARIAGAKGGRAGRGASKAPEPVVEEPDQETIGSRIKHFLGIE